MSAPIDVSQANSFDLIVLGGGLAGAAVAAVMARHGWRVLIVDAGQHPRFAIGESMILEGSEVLRTMADHFDVPELTALSSELFVSKLGTSHGVKRHFSFLHHTPGKTESADQMFQAVIPKWPHGHELHLFRQDADATLFNAAVGYGAVPWVCTKVADLDFSSDRVSISTECGQTASAPMIVDAAGKGSPIARKLSLRSSEGIRTNTRGLFTHMIDVPCYSDSSRAAQQAGMPYPMSEGTLHHVFHGGWMWVIPFNNHPCATNRLCSVGLMLDRDQHPLDKSIAPSVEFERFIDRYPGMKKQFRNAKSVRPWVRSDRIQYGTTRCVGDRWCLLGHAAGFIDPLFSKGIYATMQSASVLCHLLLDSGIDGDFSKDYLAPLEKLTTRYRAGNDQVVSGAYASFEHPELWRTYISVWLLGAYLEYLGLMMSRYRANDRAQYVSAISEFRLTGGAYSEFERLADDVDFILFAAGSGEALDKANCIRSRMLLFENLPHAFRDTLDGMNHLPDRKIRLRALFGSGSTLGRGDFRKHFYGDLSRVQLGKWAFAESKMMRRFAKTLTKSAGN